MTAKTINLQEWVSFGGGGFGESFYNKTDNSVILKLNKPSVPPAKSLEEFQLSKAVFEMGIPCAQPYEYVTDGERYGMIVQRILGKESFGRIIAASTNLPEDIKTRLLGYIDQLEPATTCLHGDINPASFL